MGKRSPSGVANKLGLGKPICNANNFIMPYKKAKIAR
jgi:hypothetical protein